MKCTSTRCHLEFFIEVIVSSKNDQSIQIHKSSSLKKHIVSVEDA